MKNANIKTLPNELQIDSVLALSRKSYVPILKGKQGELNALQEVPKSQRNFFTPLIELPAVPLKWGPAINESSPAKAIDAHVQSISPKLANGLEGYSAAYIDGIYLENEENLASGEEASGYVFTQLRKKGLPFIPVIGLDRVADYAAAVKLALAVGNLGACLRLNADDLDLEPAALSSQISSLLSYLQLRMSDTDLLIDFGPDVPRKSALVLQINSIPQLSKWRELIVSSSSFPKNMGGVERHSIEELERDEWLNWTYLRANADRVLRMPSFSDYGINHPVLEEIDPRVMRQSPNIRYTWTLSYVVAKGAAIPREKDNLTKLQRANLQPTIQYPKLSKAIVEHASWQGERFSNGDKFIKSCSLKECVGNAQNWRSAGMSHHIAFVVRQLANLLENE